MKTKNMIIRALFAAIMCVTAPFSFVIGVVPITATVFTLALTAFVAGSKNAFWVTTVYILAGLFGMPVFSGFKGGLSIITSPTGGFIFSYVFVVLIIGMSTKYKSKKAIVLLCSLAMLVCYFFGTVWYMFITKASLLTALSICIIPFIPFDVIKLIMAYIVAKHVKKALVI